MEEGMTEPTPGAEKEGAFSIQQQKVPDLWVGGKAGVSTLSISVASTQFVFATRVFSADTLL